MTAHLLSSELSNLISESKRKYTDVRNAAEKSLEELKALHTTSESQLGSDLRRRPEFVTPFILACSTRNAKLTSIAITCLQRLIVSSCLARQNLEEVLNAFLEATSQVLDVQLRILQSLPSIFQNYGNELSGPLLANALSICSTLQASKSNTVNNTASATLQQLVVSVFDKVASDDGKSNPSRGRALLLTSSPEAVSPSPETEEIQIEDDIILVRVAALDAYKVFNDICLITEGKLPQFIQFMAVRPNFGLELIESILNNHGKLFHSHPEQAHILRSHVMPFAITALSGRSNYAISVRATRILLICLQQHAETMIVQCEEALDLLIRTLEPDAAPTWKRILCMEVFRAVYADPDLTRELYRLYDEHEDRKSVIRNHVAALVRLASEKPAVIGLGQQSSIPGGSSMSSSSASQLAIEAGGVTGMMGGVIATQDIGNQGISMQSSTMRTPCLDQLDKAEPPPFPDSYIYSLALNCISSLAEGLARFLMSLIVAEDNRSKRRNRTKTATEPSSPASPSTAPRKDVDARRPAPRSQVPLNLLELMEHPQYMEIRTVSALIGECWPALLATCSTFLQAALDDEYYHDLVRSIQKLAQVSGLLRLSTPRDALLTTLSKAAVPSHVISAHSLPLSSAMLPGKSAVSGNTKGMLNVETAIRTVSSSSSEKRSAGIEANSPLLNTRNLLCLRALLNLGIALGPTLGSAWSIILETMQQADSVLYVASKKPARPSGADALNGSDGSAWYSGIASEARAIEMATSRLLESTSDFPNDGFVEFLRAMCKLLGVVNTTEIRDRSTASELSPPSVTAMPVHRRASTFVIGPMASSMPSLRIREDQFALVKLSDLANVNLLRLTGCAPDLSGWSILEEQLVGIAASRDVDGSIRVKAAEALDSIVVSAMKISATEDAEILGPIQRRFLSALQTQIETLKDNSNSLGGTEREVHRLALEALETVLEQCGESLVAGWDIVFGLIDSAFGKETANDILRRPPRQRLVSSTPAKLIRTSFNSLRLICSDFLASLPVSCVQVLVHSLLQFCCQSDLNISLTTITFFWNVSDFLQQKVGPGCLTESTCRDHSILLDSARKDTRLDESIRDMSEVDASATLWLLLLLRLTAVTTDHRPEVRNGAVHTLLRIFDAYGDQIRLEAWPACLAVVIYTMLNDHNSVLEGMYKPDGNQAELEKDAWEETTLLLLDGVARVWSDYLEAMTRADAKVEEDSWRTLLLFYETNLRRMRILVNSTVYASLQRILAQVDTVDRVGPRAMSVLWKFWSDGLAIAEPEGSSMTRGACQEALSNYLAIFKELYRLLESTLDIAQLTMAMGRVSECARFPDQPSFSNDVKDLTSLQKHILGCIVQIRVGDPEVLRLIVATASDLVLLPFDRDRERRPSSYVALARSSIYFLEALTLTHMRRPEVSAGGMLSTFLGALALPIERKYASDSPTHGSQLFRQATTISLRIVAAIFETGESAPNIDEKGMHQIWMRVVKTMNAIMTARKPPVSLDISTILADQAFDIASFRTLRDLIIPSLGSSLLPGGILRSFAETLFQNSLIHALEPGELSDSDRDEVLGRLYQPRRGRTYDPPPSKREKMCYVCLDELVSLVARHDCSRERVRLAQAASPFLILRIGLTLRAYIADQPLRGLCPPPLSQRREIIYLLDAMLKLDCEPRAIPTAPGVTSEGKKHLHRLWPLVSKALRVTAGDAEVLEKLGQVGDAVAEEMGIL